MITARFSGESVASNSTEAFSLFEKSRFGEKIGEKIEYGLVEALYLVNEGKMTICSLDGKNLDFAVLIKRIKRIDKKIEGKFIVFSDLRKRGYIVKTALKFGADFRVYSKGKRPGEEHALWIVFVARENDNLEWHDFTAKNRVAHSTKKKLLLAIVDEEGDVSYYQCDWVRM